MTGGDILFLLSPWEPSPLLLAIFSVCAVLYWRGAQRGGISAGRQIAFWCGMALFHIALQTGLDYYGEHLFAVHRVQQMLLHHLAPLLIALACPGEALIAGVPEKWRQRTGRWLRPLARMGAWLNGPIAAPVLFCALTVLWLMPAVHQPAMLNAGLYRLMNWSMALNGLMFWHVVINGRASVPVRIVMALAVIPVQVIAGLVLIFAAQDLYPVYALCGRIAALGAHADQQAGGAILWLSAAMMSLVAVAVLAWRMLAPSEKRPSAVREQVSPPAG